MVQPHLPQLAAFDNPFFLHRDLLITPSHPMGGVGHDLGKQQGVTMLENSTNYPLCWTLPKFKVHAIDEKMITELVAQTASLEEKNSSSPTWSPGRLPPAEKSAVDTPGLSLPSAGFANALTRASNVY